MQALKFATIITMLTFSAATMPAHASVYHTSTSMYASADQTLAKGRAPWAYSTTHQPAHQQLKANHTLTVYINVTGRLARNYRAALAVWNRLNVIHFVEQSSPDGANITLNGRASDPNAYAYTVTPLSDDGTIQYAHIYLTKDGLVQSNRDQINTMEHELGHAIGLAHDPRVAHTNGFLSAEIMYGGRQDVDHYTGLNARVVRAIEAVYDKQFR